jgi:predicted RNA-binding Zn-ribbon protein involved in translation (DUF1610 family)
MNASFPKIMTQSFKCPSCNAPLKLKEAAVQTCRFCGSDVIVPPNSVKPKENVSETMLPPEDEKLINVSELGQKAIKIAEIKQAIKGNRKVSAAVLFRDSFGGSLADAREIIESIESGKSISLPDFQADKQNSELRDSRKTSRSKWLIFFALICAAVILFLLFRANLFG